MSAPSNRRSGSSRLRAGRLADVRIVLGVVADTRSPIRTSVEPITELELVPHPANVQPPDTIEAEYAWKAVC